MSSALGRAFTTKRAPKPADISTPMPKRSVTTKQSMGNIRNKISGPVELISTTNMLSYNAPDIYPSSATSTRSSSNSAITSGDDSDRSPTGTSTPMTSPDTSSIEGSPTTLEPNHLSCYFGAPSRQSASSQEAPIIPQRALSHTKRTAEALAHKRSNSRIASSSTTKSSMSSMSSMSSPKMSPTNSLTQARSSINMFAANVETMDHHPFGKELAQVTEIAEEYGLTERMAAPIDPEEQDLLSRGLLKFCVDDYLSIIQPYFEAAFAEPKAQPAVSTMWI